MKYCFHCGGVLKDEAVFCGHCGKTTVDAAVTGEVNSKKSKGISWFAWLSIIAVVLISVSVSAFFLSPDVENYVRTLIPGMNRSTPIAAVVPQSQPTQGPPQGVQAPAQVLAGNKINAMVLNDFRVSVQAKERFNTEIIDLAGQINGRIGQTGGLRNAQDLRSKAQVLVNSIENESRQLASKNYPDEMQNAKALLLQLLDLEMTRARSLYNGLIEGGNGQDYKSSFSVGTSASYKFDEVNNKFVLENNTLDSKVNR